MFLCFKSLCYICINKNTNNMNKKLKALISGVTIQMDSCKAYMNTKYGCNYSPEKIFKEFINKCGTIIKNKIAIGSYCAIIDIGKDLKQYKDNIVSYFRDSLDYKVACIDAEMLNSMSGGGEGFDLDTEYIFISWKVPTLANLDDEKIEEILNMALGNFSSKVDSSVSSYVEE